MIVLNISIRVTELFDRLILPKIVLNQLEGVKGWIRILLTKGKYSELFVHKFLQIDTNYLVFFISDRY